MGDVNRIKIQNKQTIEFQFLKPRLVIA